MELFPRFVVDAVLLGGLYCLMAVGLSLAYGVTRIINFAYGEFVMLGAYGAYLLATYAHLDPVVTLPLVACAVALIAWIIFKLCLGRVLDAPHTNQILLLFAVGLVVQNVVALVMTGDDRSVSTSYSLSATDVGNLSLPHGRLIAFVVSLALAAVLVLWLKRTTLGRATQAVAQNQVAATVNGINVERMYALSFMVSAALGAASGSVVSFLLTVSPFMGFHVLVKGFAIVVLGGLGSIAGTFVAAFVLALAETGVAYFVPEGGGWAEGVALAVLLVVLIMRPTGILGRVSVDS